MENTLQPIGKQIVIRHSYKKKTDTGLHLPDMAQQPLESRVVFVGTSPEIPKEIYPGVQIVISQYSGKEIEWDGEMLRVILLEDVIGVIIKKPRSEPPSLSVLGADA